MVVRRVRGMFAMAELRPSVVSFLAAVTDRHCEKRGITTIEAKENVAASVLRFYEAGNHTEEDLLELLEWEDNPVRFMQRKRARR